MKTRQQLFDNAVAGIWSQGGPAIEVVNNPDACPTQQALCRYRTKDGKKCVIGWNIDDADYTPDLEMLTTTNDPVRVAAGIAPDDMNFARELQIIHDSAARASSNINRPVAFMTEFLAQMGTLADKNKLDTMILDEVTELYARQQERKVQ